MMQFNSYEHINETTEDIEIFELIRCYVKEKVVEEHDDDQRSSVYGLQ